MPYTILTSDWSRLSNSGDVSTKSVTDYGSPPAMALLRRAAVRERHMCVSFGLGVTVTARNAKHAPAARRPATLALALGALICALLVSWGFPAQAEPWLRHTIDRSSRGADGARLADINGDGRPDIATGWEEGGLVRAYLHPGEGLVRSAWPAVTVGQVRSPEDAVFVDLDGDGRLDVVSSCEGKTRTLFAHWSPQSPAHLLKPGKWKTAPFPHFQGRRQWMFALPLDIDGRHSHDLVVGAKGNGAEVGWLQAPEDGRNLDDWRYHALCPAGWIMSLRALDMDGDGDRDVLVSDRKGPRRGVFWLEHPGIEAAARGKAWQEHRLGGSDREVMFLDIADLDGDGRSEVAVATRSKGVLILRRDSADGDSAEGVSAGTQKWITSEIAMPPNCGGAKSVAMADIDLDGRRDIVFSCEGAAGGKSGLRWLKWLDSPFTGNWIDTEISGPQGIKFDLLQLHDLDGDGDLDVITCEERDNLGLIWYENPAR